MTILGQVAAGLEGGREQFDRIMQEMEYSSSDGVAESVLSLSDNVDFLRQLISEGYSGRFRCIYIDPPFFTRSKFNAAVSVKSGDGSSHRIRHLAFDDRFERSLECYVENMTVRILLMKELLAQDGTLWVHLDWHSSHYIRLVLDELLGDRNFVN